MTKKLRAIVFSLLFILFVFVGALFVLSQKQKVTPSPTSTLQEQKMVVLKIDFGNEDPIQAEYTFTEERTVFDALKDTAEKENILLEIQQYDFGVFIKSIGGYEGSEEKAWIYFVNEESGTVAADNQILKDGDLVEWKYIEPEM